MTEEQRLNIYLELADKISPEGAEFLMAQSPPGGWEQFATKSDLKELAAQMTVKFAELEVRMEQRFTDFEVRMEQGFTDFEVRMEQGFARLEARRSRDVWAFVAAVATIMVTIIVAVAFIG